MPGTLTPPGGKVEGARDDRDVLEGTLRREVREECGIEVADDVLYVESHAFEGAGEVILDIVMLCRYASGDPRPQDPDEIAGIEWLTYDEIMADQRAMAWTRESLRRVDLVRGERGW
jgi:ADP-ribose pyrophosphatase YjhB (NUDIX family)